MEEENQEDDDEGEVRKSMSVWQNRRKRVEGEILGWTGSDKAVKQNVSTKPVHILKYTADQKI